MHGCARFPARGGRHIRAQIGPVPELRLIENFLVIRQIKIVTSQREPVCHLMDRRLAFINRDGFNRAIAGAFARRLAWLLAFVAMVSALLWPALANRFPLMFYDTGGYLVPLFDREPFLGRSALYGAFLALGIPFDFWPNVVIQAVLSGWLVILTLRAHGFGRSLAGVLVVVLALAALTSLPWYAAQLMPDVLAQLAVLALYLVAFRRRALCRFEAVLLCAVVAFAEASHMGTLGLMLALLALLLTLRQIGTRQARPHVTTPAAAIVAGIALALLSNLAITGSFAFTPGGTTIAFTRLVDDGIVKHYLDDNCPNTEIRLCAFRNDLPQGRGEWLWNDTGPLAKLGGWQNYEDEARRIMLDSLSALSWPALQIRAVQYFGAVHARRDGGWFGRLDEARTVGNGALCAAGLPALLHRAAADGRI